MGIQLRLARVASFCLCADYAAAVGAFPFFFFNFQKVFHALVFNMGETLDYACTIFYFVVFVDFFQVVAWKIWALVAKLDFFSVCLIFAVFFENVQVLNLVRQPLHGSVFSPLSL
jgi:hypothetical protein